MAQSFTYRKTTNVKRTPEIGLTIDSPELSLLRNEHIRASSVSLIYCHTINFHFDILTNNFIVCGTLCVLVSMWCDIKTETKEHSMELYFNPTTADSPQDVWWTVSRKYTVLFLSPDIKNTRFNQYLPVFLTSLNVSGSTFQKLVMFWIWRHHYNQHAWHVNMVKQIASQFFIHLTSFVVSMFKLYCFTSPFVPILEATSIVH